MNHKKQKTPARRRFSGGKNDSSFVYPYKGNLYINLTNRCATECRYCIKNSWEWRFRGHSLKIDREPSAAEVIASVHAQASPKSKEIVFCGYGEPFLRFDVLKEAARSLKSKGYTVRINTSGLGNLINNRNVVPELAGRIDEISVSLNAESPEKYLLLHRPRTGLKTFEGVLDFIRGCRVHIPRVVMTTIDIPDNWRPGLPGVDIERCRAIADGLNVEFRVRPFLDTYEDA